MIRQASSTRIRLLLQAHAGEIERGSKVLDIGCGNGLISRAIAKTYSCDIHGADIENHLEHDVPFHAIVDGRIDVPDQSFDVALFTDVLHHIEKDRQAGAIREGLRVSRKVLIFEQHPTITAKVLDVVMIYALYAGNMPLPLSHRGPDDWAQLIAADVRATSRVKHVTSPIIYPLRHFSIMLERPRDAVVGA